MIQTMNNCVAIGHGAGMNLKDESYKVLIGHGVELDSDNVVHIGENVVFSKSVWEAICKALKEECNLEHEDAFSHHSWEFASNEGVKKLREKHKDMIDETGNLILPYLNQQEQK